MKVALRAVSIAIVTTACNVDSHSTTTGGIGSGQSGICPRAMIVLNSDYNSTSVTIMSLDGKVLSAAIVSSASSSVGVSAALSGDVVLPHDRLSFNEVVLLDRYPNGVLTWVDPNTATVRNQLRVNTGFAANPHDYIQLSPQKAYVTRYSTNSNPGRESFDQGGDLLIINPSTAEITGRIDLASPNEGFLPFPERMTLVGSDVAVILGNLAPNFKDGGEGVLVGIDSVTDAVSWKVSLPGLANCGSASLAPSGKRLAIACSGVFAVGRAGQVVRSDIVTLDVTRRPPLEEWRYHVPSSLEGRPVAPTLAFANDDDLFGVAYGDLQEGKKDIAFRLNITARTVVPIAEAQAFTLSDVSCTPGCNQPCYLADASKRGIVALFIEGEHVRLGPTNPTDATTGLPPRYIGLF